MAEAASAPDLRAVTEIQRQVWSQGDFAVIGGTLVIVAEQLAEAANVRAGERVLDVACGAGNGAIAAARRTWAPTVGLDYVPQLLERARERAAAERFEVELVEGDAQQMPFGDASFDVVLSIFGAMFAPDHRRAADELVRVCRPGGRIALACWTPRSFPGEMFAIVAEHAPPPPGIEPPSLWGTEEHVRELFGDRVAGLRAEPRHAVLRYRSPEHWAEIFRTWFGPLKVAFERVGTEGEQALYDDMVALAARHNTDQQALVAPSEYLEIVATRV